MIDHLGLQPPLAAPLAAEPFRGAAAGAKLAQHANVAIKIGGACTLSRQPFFHLDLWQPLGRVIDAFGIERCLLGDRLTRATALLTY